MTKKITAVLLALLMLLGAAVPAVAEDEAYEIPERCELYAESNLLRMGYSDLEHRDELAVGDELSVIYSSAEGPAEVYVNGALDAVIGDEETDPEIYFYRISKSGTLDIEVRRGGETLISRSFRIIKSEEMYRKELREALDALKELRAPTKDELVDGANSGFPVGNPFLVPAMMMTLMVNVFTLIFAFTRIVRE